LRANENDNGPPWINPVSTLRRAIVVLVLALWGIPVRPVVAAPAHPMQVRIALYLIALRGIDVASGAFTADFYVTLRCVKF
jgi:hypothetical protein